MTTQLAKYFNINSNQVILAEMPLRDTVCRCMHISSKSSENFSIEDYFIVADKVFFQSFKQNPCKMEMNSWHIFNFPQTKDTSVFPWMQRNTSTYII